MLGVHFETASRTNDVYLKGRKFHKSIFAIYVEQLDSGRK